MTGTTTQACAACKFQRRKCSPECPLAPYFPPDQPKQFLNVHKLYGVSNTLRILKQVDPSKRNDAMKSILYEADARDRDPVHGCFGIITLLQSQAEMLREELEYVRAQIHILEQHQALAYYSHHHQQQQALLSYSNHLESMTTSSGDSYHCNTPTGCISNQNWQNQSLPSSSCTSPTTPTPTPNWIYQYMATATSQMQAALDSSVSPIGTRGFLSKPSIEVRPSFDTRSFANYDSPPQHSYHDSAHKAEAYESSAESSVKDSHQTLEHDELESAAALFTLTSGQTN